VGNSRHRDVLHLACGGHPGIILLAFIVHWAGGAALSLRLGHFFLKVGFT
jgi:hypothetical protein